MSMVCTCIVQTGDVSGLESQFWKATVSLWKGTAYQNQLHRAEFLKKVSVSRLVEKLLAHCGNRRLITVFTKPATCPNPELDETTPRPSMPHV